jgi:hypothetical protein
MIGFPAYDVIRATAYLQRQLDKLGYSTRRVMPHVIHVSWKRPQSTGPVIIDHSHEEQQQLPTLANLAKTAQKIRSKHK